MSLNTILQGIVIKTDPSLTVSPSVGSAEPNLANNFEYELSLVTVSILDKDYQVSCKPDEVSALQQSARYLDKKMREIKSGSSILGLDRIAVMAALNIANDYLSENQKTESLVASQAREIAFLTGKLDQALVRLKSVNR